MFKKFKKSFLIGATSLVLVGGVFGAVGKKDYVNTSAHSFVDGVDFYTPFYISQVMGGMFYVEHNYIYLEELDFEDFNFFNYVYTFNGILDNSLLYITIDFYDETMADISSTDFYVDNSYKYDIFHNYSIEYSFVGLVFRFSNTLVGDYENYELSTVPIIATETYARYANRGSYGSLTTGGISHIVDTVTTLLSGLGVGISGFFLALFTNGNGGLSAVAIWVIILLGVAIALGAIAWVATLIRGKQR